MVVSPGDETAVIAKRFEGVEVLELERRLEAGEARNLGRERAGRCDYLLFLDADCRVEAGTVETLFESLGEDGLGAVCARVLGEGGGVVGWLRHALEFKEVDVSAPGGRAEFLPSTCLLCRAGAFDRAGGFPRIWPGEDLVLSWHMRECGYGLRIDRTARVFHRHPQGFATMLRHQYRLGRGSARARLLTGMRGVFFARHPLLGCFLLAGRAFRGLAWFVRFRPAEIGLFLLLFPLYIAGLAVWTSGFVAGSLAEAA